MKNAIIMDRSRNRELLIASKEGAPNITTDSTRLKGRFFGSSVFQEKDLMKQVTREILYNELLRTKRRKR
jgi:hypothetical protein